MQLFQNLDLRKYIPETYSIPLPMILYKPLTEFIPGMQTFGILLCHNPSIILETGNQRPPLRKLKNGVLEIRSAWLQRLYKWILPQLRELKVSHQLDQEWRLLHETSELLKYTHEREPTCTSLIDDGWQIGKPTKECKFILQRLNLHHRDLQDL